eukprot:4539433-Amphidinium_carterae.1
MVNAVNVVRSWMVSAVNVKKILVQLVRSWMVSAVTVISSRRPVWDTLEKKIRTISAVNTHSWISQFNQDSFDSWGAGRLPTQQSAHLSQTHPLDSRGASWQPNHWGARLSQGFRFRAKVRIMDSVSLDVTFGVTVEVTDVNSHDYDVSEDTHCWTAEFTQDSKSISHSRGRSQGSFQVMTGAPSTPSSVPPPTEELVPTSIVGSPQYLPASAPVSSPTPSMAEMTQLDLMGAWDCLQDSVYMTPSEATEYWKGDSMMAVHLHTQEWADLIKSTTSIQVLSTPQSGEPEGWQTVFIHSTMETLKQRIPTRDLGERFAFPSALQCGLHRTAHHHFQLSNASRLIREEYMIDHGHSSTNGYAKSVRINLKIDDEIVKLAGLIHITPAVKEYLSSEAGLALTRTSISQVDTFQKN